VIIVVLLGAKGIFRPEEVEAINVNENTDIRAAYQQIKTQGKPAIIVMTYYSDCCTDTSEFCADYNKKAKQLIEDYNTKMGSLYLDSTYLTEDQRKIQLEIAVENKVLEYPAIVFLDAEGKTYKTFPSYFDDKKLREEADRLVKK
jgi:thioredoxin-related protein